MTAAEIRKTFLEYFRSKQHEIVPSSPMVVKNDPTLMFTNAGMNQFKDLFLGNSPIKHPRIADTQKCLRVSGKHNDLEEVGVDTYHHTMFEMLGNWSFGDYFKKEAIEWSWELLTEVYKIDKDRMYVTVFEGSKDDGLGFDQEAYDHWKKFIAEDRILKGNKKDNFWEMGDTGPCGPCSEIHVDCRPDAERAKGDGASLVNNDHPQVIEIWNNVFMEFNRKADGSLEKLPAQHVDTGMGFERLVRVLQGKSSNYDTDVFMPLIRKIENLSRKKYNGADTSDAQEKINIAMRVIADHIRAISFSIADGQLPSNNGAGYVIRRILRRAIRYGYQSLEMRDPFFFQLVAVLAAEMGDAFPELRSQKELIEKVIREEEVSFYRTLENGIRRIENVCEELKSGKEKVIDGSTVFELYDTFGFPVDLTSLIARGHGLSIDESGFQKELEKQKERSRAATSIETDDWVVLREDQEEEFIGYDHLETNISIVRYRKVKQKGKELFQLVFDYTPFYPEGGGQVGDKGYLQSGNEKVFIIDTKKENNLIVHFSEKLPADPSSQFIGVVDRSKRKDTACNHSATHLLHEALRDILGTHVEQKGSLVNSEYLRFDFSHFSKMSDEEIRNVEKQVNERIRENLQLDEHRAMPVDDAKAMGAMALFGEKYGDKVRVIRFGSSVELCGGTHVRSTGEIGMFKIVSEGAVAAGIRRIEAITGTKADEHYRKQEDLLNQVSDLLKRPADVVKALTDLVQQNAELNKKMELLAKEKAGSIKSELLKKVRSVNGVNIIAQKVDLDTANIKDIAYQLKGEVKSLFLLLANEQDGKPGITVMIDESLVNERKLHAGNIVRELAKEIKGGGGGQPFFATAGGTDASGIARVLERVEELVG
ncbi:MAG TPA: alanine--tRNA ligase [Flavobacteriales bacterium]|nr:alanine--tRNA ligase [Flavobacteriales bacterium]HCA83218.1 alanine--tRNA ligase [Flavobacteriales bacterium]HRE75567.1 alanine--tRNA ligase [Flavobacteriales bacterium]HRE97187.1 alanine--tRNA ligase [Flavobacteriales bacterium]HRJ35177.1 alanine--tRNA ligase [Flavobacteriales bacterium]